ncbi:blast:Lysosomal alpha-mannosidase [Drosophila guanche]|uniref:alpha-mannosidase n=1 Tax=Drosophila guanche TaxID=7266 RepID=A0A3B0JH45_DROGU|nr:blast:Lysosomal alpha-mannosidase [Drosophila guanche]
MKYLSGFVLFVAAALLLHNARQSEAACGYESCPKTKSNMINIHMVPHSHDDVGWLKTVDQYYYGHKSNIQHAGVQYIIDTVVSELIKDPKRRFIQVETSFFAKWWQEQPETVKQVVKKLVNEGRFEFTGGAWSMNDEAAVNYQSVIDQFSLGLKWLDETFGACARPRIGWQIDPFGHSREQASIFAQMGYDGEFFARMDHRDKNNRLDNLAMEMIWDASDNARDALRVLTNLPEGEFESCLQLNISECAFTQDSADNVVVTLFNPLAHTSSQYVRVPVKEENYQVTDEKGRLVASEVVPVAWQVLALEYRQNTTQHELVFKASVNKIASYYIKKVDKVESKEIVLPKAAKKSVKQNEKNLEVPQRFKKVHSMQNVETHADDDSETVVQTSEIKLVIDNNTGRLKTVEMNGVSEAIDQNFAIYETYESGAYVFRQKEDVDLKFLEDKVEFTVYDGALVKEVHQQFSEWISQVIRIYEGVNRVEFEWLVGPIPTDEDTAREIVTVFDSEISSNGVFYTDSNGREMIKRVKDKREDFNPDLGRQPISGNYYPIVSRIALEDSNKRIALLNDRAQGGTSMQNGQLELMLHRRLIRDDGYGVGEALNEQKYEKPLIARGKVYLILNSVKESTKVERVAEKEIHLPFSVFFSKGSSQSSSAVAKTLPSFDDFPQSVHLLTLEPFTDDEILLRVENFLDHIEGNVVSFNIRPIFDGVGGVAIRETTLDGNLPLSEMKRFKFHHDASGHSPAEVEYFTTAHKPLAAVESQEASDFSVTLHPMQIRTFIIKKK